MAMSALPDWTLAKTLSKDISENLTFTPSSSAMALAISTSAPTIVSLPFWIVLNSKGAKWGLRATVNVPLSCTFSKVSFDEEQAAKAVKAKIPANPNKSFFHVFIINLFSIFINLCKYNNVLLCICQRKNGLLLIIIFIFINIGIAINLVIRLF